MANKKGLVQQVADSIYQMILTEKKYNPGDRLPGENILAAQLNVGRSTLREAIRILVSQGILVVYRGKGTFINTEITAFQNLGFAERQRRRHFVDGEECLLECTGRSLYICGNV